MTSIVEDLTKRHRRINRLIDTSKALGLQNELKQLKRVRLRLKDRLTAALANSTATAG